MFAIAVMGLAFALFGLFVFVISGPLATWATNWNIFLRAENASAYRTKKLRGIRILAIAWLILGGGSLLVALVGWIAEMT